MEASERNAASILALIRGFTRVASPGMVRTIGVLCANTSRKSAVTASKPNSHAAERRSNQCTRTFASFIGIHRPHPDRI
jgi:hypothetical protein